MYYFSAKFYLYLDVFDVKDNCPKLFTGLVFIYDTPISMWEIAETLNMILPRTNHKEIL